MQKFSGKKRVDAVDFASSEIKEFERLLNELTKMHDLSDFELLNKIRNRECIPLSIFTKKTSPLETVVKFLRENRGHSFKEIGVLLSRSQKNAWQAYNSAVKKFPKPFLPKYSEYDVDVSVLADRKFSILEAIVSSLKQKGLGFHEIGLLLKRNEKTAWTCWNRAQKKK